MLWGNPFFITDSRGKRSATRPKRKDPTPILGAAPAVNDRLCAVTSRPEPAIETVQSVGSEANQKRAHAEKVWVRPLCLLPTPVNEGLRRVE